MEHNLSEPVRCAFSQKEEQGQIRIARVEEDVLRRSGATLLTVEQSSPEQRQAPTPDITQVKIPWTEKKEAYNHTVNSLSSLKKLFFMTHTSIQEHLQKIKKQRN